MSKRPLDTELNQIGLQNLAIVNGYDAKPEKAVAAANCLVCKKAKPTTLLPPAPRVRAELAPSTRVLTQLEQT